MCAAAAPDCVVSAQRCPRLTYYCPSPVTIFICFSGEALSSISYVSHMSVTTMCAGAAHGVRVTYRDSLLDDPPGPRPVAAVPGTTIAVEDLFYNVPTRRKALKSAGEEYARILDVVSRYAVGRPGVSFSVKRAGEPRTDLTTSSTSSVVDNIRSIYGPAVAKELLEVAACSSGPPPSPHMGPDAPLSFSARGYVTGPSYAAKRSVLVLFINGRCVECGPLKRSLEATYAALLPKAAKPFMFIVSGRTD